MASWNGSTNSFTYSLRAVDFYGSEVENSSSIIQVSSDVSVSMQKIVLASSTISITSSSSSTLRKVNLAKVNSIQEAIAFAIASVELSLSASIAIQSRFLIAGFTAFNENRQGEDVRTPRTLLVIDDKPLSEHNRKLTSSITRSFVENRNWSSSRSRYYKTSGNRRTFSINWSYLPGERDDTADLRFGRNKIQSIASDPDVHELKILNFDTDGETPYSEDVYEVVVTNYSENLIRRDVSNGVYLWDCSLELEEV